MFRSSFSKTCHESAISEAGKMQGEFCSTLQGNAGNCPKGPDKRCSILGGSFHIDLILRHFFSPLPTEMASKSVEARRTLLTGSDHYNEPISHNFTDLVVDTAPISSSALIGNIKAIAFENLLDSPHAFRKMKQLSV
jgi:hypothetical protein